MRTWYRETGGWPEAIADLTKAPPAKDGKPAIPAPLIEVEGRVGTELAWDKPAARCAAPGPTRRPAPTTT
jgi:hypothetical protein